jgi:hypothetical protein
VFASLGRRGDDFVVGGIIFGVGGGAIFGTGDGFTAQPIFFSPLNIICAQIQLTVVGAS